MEIQNICQLYKILLFKYPNMFGILIPSEMLIILFSCDHAPERQRNERGVEGEETRGQEELHDPQEESFGKFNKFKLVCST